MITGAPQRDHRGGLGRGNCGGRRGLVSGIGTGRRRPRLSVGSAQAAVLTAPSIERTRPASLVLILSARLPGRPLGPLPLPPLPRALAVFGEADLVKNEADDADKPDPDQDRGRGAAGAARNERPARHAHQRHRDGGAVADGPGSRAQWVRGGRRDRRCQTTTGCPRGRGPSTRASRSPCLPARARRLPPPRAPRRGGRRDRRPSRRG